MSKFRYDYVGLCDQTLQLRKRFVRVSSTSLILLFLYPTLASAESFSHYLNCLKVKLSGTPQLNRVDPLTLTPTAVAGETTSGVVENCCTRFSLKGKRFVAAYAPSTPKNPNKAHMDIFFTGSGLHSYSYLSSGHLIPPGYKLDLPLNVEVNVANFRPLFSEQLSSLEILRAFSQIEQKPSWEISALAGHHEGAFSKVYLVNQPGIKEPWSSAILKVRKPVSSGEEWSGASAIRRDLALSNFLDLIARGATFNGKPFIRVEKYDLDHYLPLARQGILKQNYVNGISASEIQSYLDVIEGRVTPIAGYTPQHFIDFLKDYGLDPQHAQRMIYALEQFYRDAEPIAHAFAEENGIASVYNRNSKGVLRRGSSASNSMSPVTLDYNHGQNVIWDKNTLSWVVIDF